MLKKILYINACVRQNSRTKRLADCLISCLEGETEEIRLENMDFGLSDESFIKERIRLLAKGEYDHPMFSLARTFAAADLIVIAAPYWDLSFPAALKQYFEKINAIGITFFYDEAGQPRGLCKARKLYYVTTAGGPIDSDAFGYGYVKALAETFYGIPETERISLENLDLDGADAEAMFREAVRSLRKRMEGPGSGKKGKTEEDRG